MLQRSVGSVVAMRSALSYTTLTPSYLIQRSFGSSSKKPSKQPTFFEQHSLYEVNESTDFRSDMENLWPPQGRPDKDLRLLRDSPDGIYRRPVSWTEPTMPLKDNHDMMWPDAAAPEPLLDQYTQFRTFREFAVPSLIYWGSIWFVVGGAWLYVTFIHQNIPATPREYPEDENFVATGAVNIPMVRMRTAGEYDPMFLEWMRMKHSASEANRLAALAAAE